MSDRDPKLSNVPTRVLGDTRVDRPATKPTGAPACLVFIAGERVGHKVALRPGRIEVGREPSCDIMLVSDLVSRNHARFVVGGEQALLVDLGSTNGTYVNDQRIRDRILADGDRISFGQVMLKYLAQGNAEAAYHDEVFRLVSHDGLTEVYNRRYFDEQLAAHLQAQTPLALLFLDADHFKQINDSYGHSGGDVVLRSVARRIAGLLPQNGFVARLGGEEFAVLLWAVELAAVMQEGVALAETIRAAVDATPIDFGDQRIAVTVSVGVAWASPSMSHVFSAEALTQLADERLYAAKQAGRNRVCASR